MTDAETVGPSIQDRTYQLRNIAIDATLALARGIGRAVEAGAEPRRIEAARTYQRRAQFLADYVEAENSMGFHADQEAARVLGLSINYARLGTEALFGDGPPDADPELIASPPATVVPGEGRPGSVFRHRTNADLARPGD